MTSELTMLIVWNGIKRVLMRRTRVAVFDEIQLYQVTRGNSPNLPAGLVCRTEKNVTAVYLIESLSKDCDAPAGAYSSHLGVISLPLGLCL